MRKILIHLIIFVGLITLCGCGNNKLEKDYYGGELYNAVYGSENGEVLHTVPIMSRRNLSDVTDVQVEFEGGEFSFDYSIEDSGYKLDDYNLYQINLNFSNVKFDSDVINVKKIILYYEDNSDDINLDRCQIAKIDGIYKNEHIDINGSPLKVPADMLMLPVEISTDDQITIEDIFVLNDNFQITGVDGTIIESFAKTPVSKEDDIVTFNNNFKIADSSDLAPYKQYGTTIVVKYSENNEVYYTLAGIPRSIYNPFSNEYNAIESYFNYLKDN